MSYDRQWTTLGRNILTAESLDAARGAVEKGWLCGMHYYFEGGRGGDAIAFGQYSDYLVYLHGSTKPGDLFCLWSVSKLLNEGVLLLASRFGAPASAEAVFEYVGVPGNEILAVGANKDFAPTAVLTDEGGSNWQAFLKMLELSNFGGEIYVLPFTALDRHGQYFIEAKLPNERGEVPLGGAY
jgi:hypothetical protein